MHAPEIAVILSAAYVGIGALLSWRGARAVTRADPSKLCSAPCREWHGMALPFALNISAAPNAAILHFVTGLGWSIAMAMRCGCFRRAAHDH